MNEFDLELGKAIKKIRLLTNLTQKAFAETAKIQPSQLSSYENGRIQKLSISQLCRIAKAGNCRFIISFPRIEKEENLKKQ